MLTASAIGVASRLSLRARLTLIRLAWIRKPWSYGEGVSRTLYRYLYLHLPAPLQCSPTNTASRAEFHGFGTGLHARLLSTRDRSTGELLRTPWMNGCFQANIPAVSAVTLRYCLQLSPDSRTLAGGLSCSSLGHGR